MSHRSRQLRVSSLARVEGEGALHVRIADGTVERVELNIYEPPRFFEAFLRGRAHTEPPDITARICGICPVAYQTSACNAIEQACGVTLDPQLADVRRLLYCGEWISSHALHIYLLHAPDFLGHPDAISRATRHRELVERGLALKKAGNTLLETFGGRAIHPVNVRVGGFYSLPTRAELAPLAEVLRRALDIALDTVRWTAGFEFPDLELDHDFLAADEPGRYAIADGTLRTTSGTTFPVTFFVVPDPGAVVTRPGMTNAPSRTHDPGGGVTGSGGIEGPLIGTRPPEGRSRRNVGAGHRCPPGDHVTANERHGG